MKQEQDFSVVSLLLSTSNVLLCLATENVICAVYCCGPDDLEFSARQSP